MPHFLTLRHLEPKGLNIQQFAAAGPSPSTAENHTPALPVRTCHDPNFSGKEDYHDPL